MGGCRYDFTCNGGWGSAKRIGRMLILFELLLSISAVVVGGGMVFLAFRLCLRRPWRPYPACARCAYPTHGLETEICPECGAIRAQVGLAIAKPKVKVLEGLLLGVGVFAVGLGLFCILVNFPL